MTPSTRTAHGMVERVARAIIESCHGPWELMLPEGQETALREARAAILAMREPTQEMLKASFAALPSYVLTLPIGSKERNSFVPGRIKHVVRFQAMIDAALSADAALGDEG